RASEGDTGRTDASSGGFAGNERGNEGRIGQDENDELTGGKTNGKTDSNSGRTYGISERTGNQGRGDREDNKNLSFRGATSENAGNNSGNDRRWKNTQTSSGGNVADYMEGRNTTSGRSGGGTDGRRYLDAVINGDEKTARELLDKKAKEKGYIFCNIDIKKVIDHQGTLMSKDSASSQSMTDYETTIAESYEAVKRQQFYQNKKRRNLYASFFI
ncbi:MAG: hypothetical protein II982_02265, partial [Clostridia bacterium]|nr:hypothetical protein [Clostridia bacterium]